MHLNSNYLVAMSKMFLFRPQGRAAYLECRCRDCEKTWGISIHGKHLPPEIVANKARKAGWFIQEGKKPRCPEHAVNPKRYTTIKMREEPPGPVTQPLKPIGTVIDDALKLVEKPVLMPFRASMEPPPNPMASMTADPKLTRKVMGLLEDHFDESIKRYKDGYSDERIVKETGLHIMQVAKIRTEFFGELADDPSIQKLQDDLAEFELKCEELFNESKKLSQRLEGFIAARKITGKV